MPQPKSRKRGRRSASRPRHATAQPQPARPAARRQPGARRERIPAAERDAAIRATLTPYAPGERPWAIRLGALAALLLGWIPLILYVVGTKLPVAGEKPKASVVIVYFLLMTACAWGTWTKRYWAVLGLQTLLVLLVLSVFLALVKASSILGALVCLVLIGLGGTLFYKLVRVLSRIQLPERPSRRSEPLG